MVDGGEASTAPVDIFLGAVAKCKGWAGGYVPCSLPTRIAVGNCEYSEAKHISLAHSCSARQPFPSLGIYARTD